MNPSKTIPEVEGPQQQQMTKWLKKLKSWSSKIVVWRSLPLVWCTTIWTWVRFHPGVYHDCWHLNKHCAVRNVQKIIWKLWPTILIFGTNCDRRRDFYLVRLLKKNLRRRLFGLDVGLKAAVEDFFGSPEETFFYKGIRSLEEKWRKCTDVERDYIKK